MIKTLVLSFLLRVLLIQLRFVGCEREITHKVNLAYTRRLETFFLKYLSYLENTITKSDEPHVNELDMYVLALFLDEVNNNRLQAAQVNVPEYWLSRQGR